MSLRITGGQFKGLTLAVPRTIRATEAKVRQALFNIVGSAVEGARVLDGFAGSGALGLEALSRGAAFAAFVDTDTEAVLSIRENLERLAHALPRHCWRVMQMELEPALRHLAGTEPPFDLLFLDPPYRSEEAKKALNAVVEYAKLQPSSIVAIEHEQRTALPSSTGLWQLRTQHRYGDTVLSFYGLASRTHPAGASGTTG